MMAPGAAPAMGPAAALPMLREDLRLLPHQPDVTGRPTWMLHDPLAEMYFRIEQSAFQLLVLWPHHRDPMTLAAAAAKQHEREVDLAEVQALGQFLEQHRLVVPPPEGWRALSAQVDKQRHSLAGWLLHNYLFVKVPLVRPGPFLKATLPVARLLASAPSLALIGCLGLIGLLMALRQWNQFAGTFTDFLSPAGAMAFGAALLFLKLLHELGHAYVATAKGCRVSSMGVAFMLGAPMAYTDVTDAWRLPHRRDRMAIDFAGVSVELCVAALATFAWVFLPDGPLRAMAFVFATLGWVMSLAINLNPFMRFDGYFILADWLRVPNLQPRSFALARWHLRRTLFGSGEAMPDHLPDRLVGWMILYGYSVWLYRLVLFTGIAIVVYQMTFKVLGLVLFAVEIVFFILLPIWREIRHWWRERRSYRRAPRSWLTGGAVVALVVAMMIPWQTRVMAPAVIEPARYQRIFPQVAGDVQIVHVKVGGMVAEGDPLVTLGSPKLASEWEKTSLRLGMVDERMNRRIADRQDLSATVRLSQEREALVARLNAIREEQAQLVIRAPIGGMITEFQPDLAPGRALSRQEEVALIVADQTQILRGYLDADQSMRVAQGAAGRFVPEDPRHPALPIKINSLSQTGVRTIEIPLLASIHGGPVETWPMAKTGELTPLHAQHPMQLEITGSVALPARQLRGVVLLEAAPESLAARMWRQVLRVLIRESGA